ncbi:hypothetical protein U6M95_12500, partial [Cutibacterium acnes]
EIHGSSTVGSKAIDDRRNAIFTNPATKNSPNRNKNVKSRKNTKIKMQKRKQWVASHSALV